MEFVWIASMLIWASKYELTENEWYAVMSIKKKGGRLPLKVGYDQSQKVCDKLNQRDKETLPNGYCYRIPTVDEWERLARCGTNRIYPWGDTMPPKFGNYSDESVVAGVQKRGGERYKLYLPPFIEGYNDGYEGLAPVEASGVNEWGLYGIGGNLWDWATTPDGDTMIKGGSAIHAGDVLRIDAGIKGIRGSRQEEAHCAASWIQRLPSDPLRDRLAQSNPLPNKFF